MNEPHQHAPRLATRWQASSLALIGVVWAILQIGGLFSPGLLDDVDSVYIQIAREMLQRHDFVTPTIDGIRFFDKPPLMYWMAAASMHLFGVHDWAARLPLALGVLALLLAVYALGNHLFADKSSDRPGLYAALILATAIGPYLYTRFFIPDILIALWMTLSVHLFLIAMNRISNPGVGAPHLASEMWEPKSALLPSLGFAAVTALNLLTKGLIGIVFPLGFVLLYLTFTRNFKALRKLHLPAATLLFAAIAAPWHILAALRNPAIAMPSGVGLPAHAGWAWFYLYNEHIARFLGRRIPHDYGQTPIWLFWVYAVLWIMPWAAFLPAAIARLKRTRQAALTLALWALLVLVFFTLSSRQEYYSLPAIPALALMIAGLLAHADSDPNAARNALACHRWILLPLGTLVALVCGYFAITAPHPAPGADLSSLLASNPDLYNVSLGHLFDLTGAAMGLFRGPLATVTLGMMVLGPVSFLLRRRSRTYAANLTLAAGMVAVLLAAHEGLARFYPILGSKGLALQIEAAHKPGDILMIDGELTSGSTLLFYTGQTAAPVLLVNGRVNGPWFGSFWPDAPQIFANDVQLESLWSGKHRVFLLTYHPQTRTSDLQRFGHVFEFAVSGGKTILTNQGNSFTR
jgi:4-amino-4-deoxy-L-arabinose transferase-like glycosyltransferase